METVVCDYTALFDFQAPLPAAPVSCKFVLLWYEQKHWLVVGKYDDFAYHAMLVHRFSKEHDLAVHWIKFLELAQLETKNATILGGGWMKIDLAAKSVRLHGTSTAYGTADYALASAALSAHPDFGRLTVSF